MHKKLEGFEYVRQTEEKGRIKYSALIPVTKQTEEYKAKRKEAGLRQREFVFGSWQNPADAEAAAIKYLETGEVAYGSGGYKVGQFKFKIENGKKTVLDPINDKEEIERLEQIRKAKYKAKKERWKLLHREKQKHLREEAAAALAAKAEQEKAVKTVVEVIKPTKYQLPHPVASKEPVARKLNALQVQEIKDVIKDVLKYKKRTQLFTIQFPQLSLVRELVTDNISIEIERDKWLYLKPKRK